MDLTTLHRLRHRLNVYLGLTSSEFRGLLVLAGLLVVGVFAREWHRRIPAVDADTYRRLEDEFRQYAARLPPAPMVGPVMPVEPPDSLRPAPPLPAGNLVDLNTADSKALQELPGIGPALAGRILTHRDQFGPFRSVSDLLMIRGIGPATLDRLRLLVTVQPRAESSNSR